VTATIAGNETSRFEKIVDRLLTPGGREQLVAERDAAALAARQAAAREEIAAITPHRVAAAKAWQAQIVKVRAAFGVLRSASAELTEIADADSASYDAQDRIRFSAGLRDALDGRLAAPGPEVGYLASAISDIERQGRKTIAGWEPR
jgi:hypothetical protein